MHPQNIFVKEQIYMRRSVIQKSAHARLGLLLSLLFALLPVPLQAQPLTGSAKQKIPVRGYSREHEVTLNATVQKVVQKAAPGSPAGMHLIVSSPQGDMDAHLGPYLTEETRQALRQGIQLQMTGVMENAKGKNYFLVRELIFSGRQVQIRTQNGFLVRLHTPRPSRSTSEKNLSQKRGGAQ
jgi:hypothetical protein